MRCGDPGETGMNCKDLFRSMCVLVWVERDKRRERDWTEEAKEQGRRAQVARLPLPVVSQAP